MKLCQSSLKLLTINKSHTRGVYSEVDSTKRVEFPSTRRFYMAKTLMLPSSRSIHSLPPSVTEQRESESVCLSVLGVSRNHFTTNVFLGPYLGNG